MSLDQVFRPELDAMKAYALPRIEGGIKLDAMENPFAWPGDLQSEWASFVSQEPLNRYPSYQIEQLTEQLTDELQLNALQGLLLGNGSDELIQMLCMACAKPGATVLTPAPSFSMYEVITRMVGSEFQTFALTPDFELDASVAIAAIKQHQPAIIYLAIPNNPTGNVFDQQVVLEIIQQAPGWVVIDEAYTVFSASDWSDALQRFPNVLILRTLSKMGLAGVRLGYMAGPKAAIETINKLRLPYNINTLSWRTACFALQHREHLAAQAAQIKTQRTWLFEQLSGIDGIHVWPSEANFLLFRLGQADPSQFYQSLQSQQIWIKRLDGSHPMLEKCFRVSVGTAAENQAFVAGAKKAFLYA